jgi:hypothetical protein
VRRDAEVDLQTSFSTSYRTQISPSNAHRILRITFHVPDAVSYRAQERADGCGDTKGLDEAPASMLASPNTEGKMWLGQVTLSFTIRAHCAANRKKRAARAGLSRECGQARRGAGAEQHAALRGAHDYRRHPGSRMHNAPEPRYSACS